MAQELAAQETSGFQAQAPECEMKGTRVLESPLGRSWRDQTHRHPVPRPPDCRLGLLGGCNAAGYGKNLRQAVGVHFRIRLAG